MGGFLERGPNRLKILSMPTVKPYLSVSKKAAIAGVCGVGPYRAMAPISVPHSAVSPTADIKIRLKRSLIVRTSESVQPT